MAEEIAVENGRMSNFEGLATLTLTLDRVILHTFVHLSSTSTYMPNFIEIEETFVDVRTDGRTGVHLRPALLGRLCRRVDLKMKNQMLRSENEGLKSKGPDCTGWKMKDHTKTVLHFQRPHLFISTSSLLTVKCFTRAQPLMR